MTEEECRAILNMFGMELVIELLSPDRMLAHAFKNGKLLVTVDTDSNNDFTESNHFARLIKKDRVQRNIDSTYSWYDKDVADYVNENLRPQE